MQDSKKEADPRLFVGSFRNNVRHGLGVANYADGEEYAGEFHAGAAEGYGVAELGDRGGVYEGEWRDGMRHGWAVSTLNNHAMWAGDNLMNILLRYTVKPFSDLLHRPVVGKYSPSMHADCCISLICGWHCIA